VRATLAAGEADLATGTIMNVAGGGSITVNQLVALLGEITGQELTVEWLAEQAGDVRQTGGSTELATQLLGWEPKVAVPEGLRAQFAWQVNGR
jgi:nucleoside-diphosphate-sugar epimerase